MHEVATVIAALAAQVSHLLAFITPADVLPPPW
jgi:hypothetical protein